MVGRDHHSVCYGIQVDPHFLRSSVHILFPRWLLITNGNPVLIQWRRQPGLSKFPSVLFSSPRAKFALPANNLHNTMIRAEVLGQQYRLFVFFFLPGRPFWQTIPKSAVESGPRRRTQDRYGALRSGTERTCVEQGLWRENSLKIDGKSAARVDMPDRADFLYLSICAVGLASNARKQSLTQAVRKRTRSSKRRFWAGWESARGFWTQFELTQ